MTHLRRLTSAGLDADITAGADHLCAIGAPHGNSVIALGFCFGGRQAFRAAAAPFALAGSTGFHGFPDVLMGAPGPTQFATDLTGPTLARWGGGDTGIPATVVAAFGDALTAAGCEHEFVTCPGAPHGFFELGTTEFAGPSLAPDTAFWCSAPATASRTRPERPPVPAGVRAAPPSRNPRTAEPPNGRRDMLHPGGPA